MSDRSLTAKNKWVLPVGLLLIVVVFAASMILGGKHGKDGEEKFGGTDAAVTTALEEDGAKPWFEPLFEPGSGEIESGLFALQAALGAGILGFALGRMSGKKAGRQEAAIKLATPAKPETAETVAPADAASTT